MMSGAMAKMGTGSSLTDLRRLGPNGHPRAASPRRPEVTRVSVQNLASQAVLVRVLALIAVAINSTKGTAIVITTLRSGTRHTTVHTLILVLIVALLTRGSPPAAAALDVERVGRSPTQCPMGRIEIEAPDEQWDELDLSQVPRSRPDAPLVRAALAVLAHEAQPCPRPRP